MKFEELGKRIEELISLGTVAQNSKEYISGSPYMKDVPFKEFRTASLSFILKTFGDTHPYYTDFYKDVRGAYPGDIAKGLGILSAIRGEFTGGWLVDFKGLVTAEIFSDFLEMSEYLLSENYKDAAAVMIGSVLEEHLRQLCLKNNIPVYFEKNGNKIPKNADKINSDLASAEIYSKLDQKNITTQLHLRNKAAHGKYNEYSEGQVKLMLQSVLDIMSRIRV